MKSIHTHPGGTRYNAEAGRKIKGKTWPKQSHIKASSSGKKTKI